MTDFDEFTITIGSVRYGGLEAVLRGQAHRGGPSGRRAARRLAAYLEGLRNPLGWCPYPKLGYARMWARGVERALDRTHRTLHPAKYRRDMARAGRRIGRALLRRRQCRVNWSIRVDATPAFDSLRKFQERLMAHQPPANPKKECPPPCP